jgi:hypothetical protein
MKPKRTVPADTFLLFVLRFVALKQAAREHRVLSDSLERSARHLLEGTSARRTRRAL